MRIDPVEMTRARIALREAVRRHLFDPNVNLVDFGHPEHGGRIAEDELAIRVHVTKKLSGPALEAAVERGFTLPIQETIDGVRVDVPEGKYHLQRWFWWGGWSRPADPRSTREDPMRGGISISDENHNAYGTLGTKVIDRATGRAMILSNWHVLAADWGALPGQRIYQPGQLDGGTSADTVASLDRDAMSTNLDAAVAWMLDNRQLINDQLDLGSVTGVGRAEVGMKVVKSGRGSGCTHGRVSAIDGVAKIRYGYLDRIIRNVVTIEPDEATYSLPGDSGSLVLNAESREAIGLHFAGSNYPERGLALDIQEVLNALNVEIPAVP